MILRILGEGQYEVSDERADDLNAHDAELAAAIERGDEAAFARALGGLLEAVRGSGRRLSDDYLGPSEGVLPGDGSSLEEVRAMLGEEGLIPG